MKLNMIAIFDIRAREYSPPQVYTTLGVAERAFYDAVNDPESKLNKHPEDYNMQNIAIYDSETGIPHALEHGPQILCTALQLLQTK